MHTLAIPHVGREVAEKMWCVNMIFLWETYCFFTQYLSFQQMAQWAILHFRTDVSVGL